LGKSALNRTEPDFSNTRHHHRGQRSSGRDQLGNRKKVSLCRTLVLKGAGQDMSGHRKKSNLARGFRTGQDTK